MSERHSCSTCRYLSHIPRIVHIPKECCVFDCTAMRTTIAKGFEDLLVCGNWSPNVAPVQQISFFDLTEE